MQSLSTREKEDLEFETVLVMQGGGSLGAYECGVFKALHRHGIKFDIVAGTSIGAVNAAIISGSKSDEPVKALEDFWLDLAEGVTDPGVPDGLRPYYAVAYSAFFGNPKAFFPRWFVPDWNFFFPFTWQYLYDTSPLKSTLKEYVDFEKIRDPNRPRLIVTATDIQNARPSVFDSKYDNIGPDHVIASAGYPFYGIAWTKISGRYLWDGTLLSNTPLREVIDASPRHNKKVYIVDLFPKNQPEIPRNMMEVYHRARDIIHSDKTQHSVRMSKIINRYLMLIGEMHEIIENTAVSEANRAKLKKIEEEYHKLACERGAIIDEVIRVKRQEHVHFLFEDADFSIGTIKELIETGERDTKAALSSASM